MAVEWYLKIADKEVGPLSAHQLRTMAGKGQIGPEDFVRQGNEGGWVPATRVKGLLAAAGSTSQTPPETIPVAKLLTPADGKSSKAKTPSTATPVRKKKPESGKTAKAAEEPAAAPNLPPVVAKGSVPPPPPPPVPAPPLPVPAVAGVQEAGEAAASPPAVPDSEMAPAVIPPSRHSPGIELPFDVSPAASSGSHARVAADKTPASGSAKAPAAKEKPKFQINYTIVAVAVVAVAAAGLFIYASMSSSDSKAGKSGKQTASTPTEKPAEDAAKEGDTPPEGAKKAEEKKKDATDDDLTGLVLKGGHPVGPAKTNTAKTEKKPDKTDTAAKEKWFDASKEPAVGKNVSVALTSAKLGNFRVRSKIIRGMQLSLRVTNTLKDDRVKCQWEVLNQWNAQQHVPVDSILSDDLGKIAYALEKISPKSGDAIDPTETVDVDMVFEKPFKTAKYLHLRLPGQIFNESDAIKIEIPIDKVKPADENADENPPPIDEGPERSSNRPSAPAHQPGPAEKGNPGGDAPEIPPIGLEAVPGDSRWQPRGGRDTQMADAEPARPTAVREQRISDFDDDPALVERYGQPSTRRDPDRKGSRHAVR